MSWLIEHEFSYGWDDAGWMGEDGPERFKTRRAAERALEEHLECCESAYRRGDLKNKECREEYRIVKANK